MQVLKSDHMIDRTHLLTNLLKVTVASYSLNFQRRPPFPTSGEEKEVSAPVRGSLPATDPVRTPQTADFRPVPDSRCSCTGWSVPSFCVPFQVDGYGMAHSPKAVR
jgi:hypothetical protein